MQDDHNQCVADAYKKACQAIDGNEVEELRQLIESYPELLSYQQSNWPEILLQQTTSYANFPGAENEEQYNRIECAELLLDAGAVMDPRVYLRMIDTGAHKMLAMFESKEVLPDNLRVATALGDHERVTASFDSTGRLNDSARPYAGLLSGYDGAEDDWPNPNDDYAILADAFLYACRLSYREIAEDLLSRCIALDEDLARRIESWTEGNGFVDFMIERTPEGGRHALKDGSSDPTPGLIWRRAIQLRLQLALEEVDVETFRSLLEAERFLLEPSSIATQVWILEVASYSPNALGVIDALLSSNPAVAIADPPPISRAISHAIEYGNHDYVPSLAQVWAIPDDLPHAAGLGDMKNVRKWFDDHGQPAIEPQKHNPYPDHFPNVTTNDVLGRSLAWAVVNGEYAVADFLLEHGANINTRWGTHEPASILHECAFYGRFEQVKYLVKNGIDLTIEDYRYQSTAEGWARFGGQDEIADFLADHTEGN